MSPTLKASIIIKLHPNVVRVKDDQAFDIEGNQVYYDVNLVQSEIDAVAHKELRAAEYPPIGDQLDALFHAGVFPSDMADKIQAIKDKYPKA